jgi:hypothetical protein
VPRPTLHLAEIAPLAVGEELELVEEVAQGRVPTPRPFAVIGSPSGGLDRAPVLIRDVVPCHSRAGSGVEDLDLVQVEDGGTEGLGSQGDLRLSVCLT